MESTGSQRVDYKTYILIGHTSSGEMTVICHLPHAVDRYSRGSPQSVQPSRRSCFARQLLYHAGWGQRDAQATIFIAGPLSISDVLSAIVQEADISSLNDATSATGHSRRSAAILVLRLRSLHPRKLTFAIHFG